MSTLTAYGHRLAELARGVPPIAVDAALVVACYLTIVIYAALDNRLDWWIVLLAAGNTLPLLWRRRYPFAMAAVVGAGTASLALADVLRDVAFAQLVATYTFASLCPPVKRLIAAACTATGVALSVLLPRDDLLNLGTNAIFFIGAYALGTSARARRDRIAMLDERARRLAEEHESATIRERERIAREMHDILAHSMSLVVVQAEAGPVAVRSDPAKAEKAFDAISATAREALGQLRRVLGVLRSDEPGRHPHAGLDAVPDLVASIRRAGLDVVVEQDGPRRPVPPDLSATAYRIVQESLTNTLRHAAATRVLVRIGWSDDALDLEIRDDGRGPGDGAGGPGPEDGLSAGRGRDAPAGTNRAGAAGAGSPGRGLIGMRERVAAAGGELVTGSGPDDVGFRVAARLPL